MMLDTMDGTNLDRGELVPESALFAAAGLPAEDLLLASVYDDARCRELVHADIRATLTTPWLRTLADFLA